MDPGTDQRKRYHLHSAAMLFTPLPPDPVTGKPGLDTIVVASLDARRVPIPDAIISFLLKVRARPR
jgi:hypothetical protein